MAVLVLRDKAAEWDASVSLAVAFGTGVRPLFEAIPEFAPETSSTTAFERALRLVQNASQLAVSGRTWFDFGHLDGPICGDAVSALYSSARSRSGLFASSLVPVIRECFPSHIAGVREYISSTGSGVGVRYCGVGRVRGSACDFPELVDELGVGFEEVDLFVDLQDLPWALCFEELESLFPEARRVRSLVVLSGSFPQSITHLSPEVYRHELPRGEWHAYLSHLSAFPGVRAPEYGDYGVQAPVYVPAPPHSPSPSVRYTVDDKYIVLRGRRSDSDFEGQFIGHSRYLLSCAEFESVLSTSADLEIRGVASGSLTSGNARVWLSRALRRHIGVVATQNGSLVGVTRQAYA